MFFHRVSNDCIDRRKDGNEYDGKNNERKVTFDERQVPKKITDGQKRCDPTDVANGVETQKPLVRHGADAGKKVVKARMHVSFTDK